MTFQTDGAESQVMATKPIGRYIEQLDLKTGKILVNKKLSADLTSLE
jgi:hypothetical protein